MRSPVQSWVPLQESTAETLGFFRLYTSSLSRRERTSAWMTLKACFPSGRHGDGRQWAKRTRLDGHSGKQHSVQGLSWVPCERTEWIRRSRPAATETSWVPPLENQALTKFSWVLFWFPWTPNLFISFNFHYFHKWLVGHSEWVFIYEFPFVRNLHSSVFQVSPQVPASKTRTNPHCRPHPF